MGIIMSCLFNPPKDVIDPLIADNKVVIIAQEGDEEKVESLKSILDKHDLPKDEITVHTLPENCHKGRMRAHVEEVTGGDELPFVTLDGAPLASYSMVMAMADSSELYKKIHGKDREEENTAENNKKGGNVNKERRPSMIDKFFGNREGGAEKKSEKKRKNTNTGSVQGSEGIKEEEETVSN